MNLTMEDPESSSCPPPSDWATLSALLKPGGKKKRLYPGNVGHRIRMLSRYVALGLVSGFALLPESRILKLLPRTLEFLPNNPGAWEQASTAYLTETTSFSSILRTKATALEAEGHVCPLVVSHQIFTVPSGARVSLDSNFESSGRLFIWNIASCPSPQGLASLLPLLTCSSSCSREPNCHLHRKAPLHPFVYNSTSSPSSVLLHACCPSFSRCPLGDKDMCYPCSQCHVQRRHQKHLLKEGVNVCARSSKWDLDASSGPQTTVEYGGLWGR